MNRKRKLLIYGGQFGPLCGPGDFLHAEKPEMQAGKYNEQGQEIIAWYQKNGVKLIKDIDSGFTLDDYCDDIHINSRGQRKLANIMLKNLQIFY